MNIRPSSLSLVAACPASWVTSGSNPSCGNDETAEGLALEDGVAAEFQGRPWSISLLEGKYQVSFADKKETEAAIKWAGQWLKDNAPKARYQVRLSTGTADFVDESGPTPHVIDIKRLAMGGDGPRLRPQFWAYSTQLDDLQPVVGSVVASVVYPNQRRADTDTFTQEDLQAFRQAIREIESNAEAQAEMTIERRSYRPGEHCGFCRGAVDCPALALKRKSALALLEAANIGTLTIDQSMLPEAVAALKGFVRAIDDDFMPLALRAVEAAGGEIASEAGTLRVQRRKIEGKVQYLNAYEWVVKNCGEQVAIEMDRQLSVNLPTKMSDPFLRLYPAKKSKVPVIQGK